jgi:hypothetical protein
MGVLVPEIQKNISGLVVVCPYPSEFLQENCSLPYPE